MARIRSTHPGQWTDEEFVQLTFAARLLCIALRNEADDNGVFEWKPTGLKMRLFPADDVSVPALLEELEGHNQVCRFQVDGREYGAIRNFRKYQRPKLPTSRHPLPEALEKYVGVKSADLPSDGEVAPQREEEGGNGIRKWKRDRKPPSKATQLPSDWALTEGWIAAASERRKRAGLPTEINYAAEAAKFASDALAKARLAKNWKEAFVKWCLADWIKPVAGNGHADPPAERRYLGKTNIPMGEAIAHVELIKAGKRLPPSCSETRMRIYVAEGLLTPDEAKQREERVA